MQHPDELKLIRRLSYLLDSAFPVPGTRFRFGLDPIIGLIPGLGDALTSVISLYIVLAGLKFKVSRWTLTRMVFNVMIDAVIGVLPVVGDILDAVWKSNEKNRILLERSLANPATKAADRWFIVLAIALMLLIIGLSAWGTILVFQWLLSLIQD